MSFVLSPTTISSYTPSPTTPSRFTSPTPSPLPPAPRNGLLIPTDRTLEELESKWLYKLGRLRVDREVVLSGYALYSLRNWFLSRTHFSHSIVTQTGRPTEHISAYLLVPAPELSAHEGSIEIANAIRLLSSESHSHPRKTDFGTLLVATPSAYGQDVNPVPGGDFRVAKPYIIVNTGLRRLGCGGRAILGLESPIPALRRKFHDLYRIPIPSQSNPIPVSRPTSPTTSPSRIALPGPSSSSPHSTTYTSSQIQTQHDMHDAINTDPFTYLVVELVKQIQAALTLWGMYDDGDEHGEAVKENMEIDGLFCDETKAAIFKWRRVMGMEHEESLKLEKETSGGCIDPKTLAALLSSITSVHYILDVLDVERLPKDPFTNVRRMLKVWEQYQLSCTKPSLVSKYFTVASIRALTQHYLADRRHGGDALRVQRLFSGVAQATSTISANLKGGYEEGSLRRREHHLHSRMGSDDESDSALVMIIPEGEVGHVAPPDVITSDLEAYTKGILKSREKDWDVMGARRVAELWNGTVGESEEGRRKKWGLGGFGSKRGNETKEKGVLKKRTQSKDYAIKEEDGEDDLKGTIKDNLGRAGQALRGGLGRMGRKYTTYDTSDSEMEGGPGPSSLKSALKKKRPGAIPTLIEPDVEEVDGQLDNALSPSPSPGASHGRPHSLHPPSFPTTKPNFLAANSRATSVRPSTITIPSGNESDVWSRASIAAGRSPDERSDYEMAHKRASWLGSSTGTNGVGGPSGTGAGMRPSISRNASDRAIAWRNRGRATVMLRANSDGADVVLEEGGHEWEVTNPRGTGRREADFGEEEEEMRMTRRHSFDDADFYRGTRTLAPHHMLIDVEMCAVVLQLREKERQLGQKVKDVKLLESAVFKAASGLVADAYKRREQVEALAAQAAALRQSLEALERGEEGEGDRELPYDRFHYYLSEETHRGELLYDLKELKEKWQEVREEGEKRRKEVERKEVKKGWWWWGR
ncbi:hypothetical protein IAT38_005324 [Cryptococcus sp. DSM 104549]